MTTHQISMIFRHASITPVSKSPILGTFALSTTASKRPNMPSILNHMHSSTKNKFKKPKTVLAHNPIPCDRPTSRWSRTKHDGMLAYARKLAYEFCSTVNVGRKKRLLEVGFNGYG